MSATLQQIYTLHPITSNLPTDLMYFVQSPYTPGTDAGMTFANFSAQFISSTSIINPAHGGTGVNNGTSTITIGGNVSFLGAFTFSGTLTGNTSVTFPTSGTLATTSQLPTPSALTEIDDTNVTMTLGGSPTVALLAPTSMTLGWTGQLSLTRGGTNASLVASNGGIVWSNASQMQILAGTATSNQILLSGASATPSWSTTTYPATNAINTIMYASSANVLSVISAANNGTLISSATGVPSWLANGTTGQVLTATTGSPPSWAAAAGVTLLTTKGDLFGFSTVNARVPVGSTNGQVLQVNSANAVGLGYSTPTYPSASGSGGQILRSDGTNNVYSTFTINNTFSINNLVFAGAANALSGLATANNGMLITSATGVPSIATTFGQGLSVSSSRLNVGGANNIFFNNGQGIQDNNGENLLTFGVTASAVNYFQITNNSTTAAPLLQSVGTDTNIGMQFATKGTEGFSFLSNAGSVNVFQMFTVASGVNYITSTASTTTNSPVLAAAGSDTNVLLQLNGRGNSGVGTQGTATNGNAISGNVGEFVTSNIVAASAVVSTNATINITSISVTAGDWDVWGNISSAFTGTTTAVSGWISTSSATLPDQSLRTTLSFPGTILSGPTFGLAVPSIRVSTASTISVFLSALNSSTTGTSATCGTIYARRVR